jgi:hypothetical protein
MEWHWYQDGGLIDLIIDFSGSKFAKLFHLHSPYLKKVWQVTLKIFVKILYKYIGQLVDEIMVQ